MTELMREWGALLTGSRVDLGSSPRSRRPGGVRPSSFEVRDGS
jgi:hypothetical protein